MDRRFTPLPRFRDLDSIFLFSRTAIDLVFERNCHLSSRSFGFFFFFRFFPPRRLFPLGFFSRGVFLDAPRASTPPIGRVPTPCWSFPFLIPLRTQRVLPFFSVPPDLSLIGPFSDPGLSFLRRLTSRDPVVPTDNFPST